MAVLLEIQNFGPSNIKDVFVLDADAAVGATSFTLKNNDGAVAGDPIVFGQLGDEGSEKLVIATVNADSVTITTTTASKLIHRRFDAVTTTVGNTINLYRAPNVSGYQPADASFAQISATTIDFDELVTSVTDSSGGTGFWYKFTYYTATGPVETSLADSTAQRGGGYAHYCSINDIRVEAGLTGNTAVSDVMIDSRRIEAEREIDAELYNVYTLPFAVPVPPQIAQCARMIASGLILGLEYGPMVNGAKDISNGLLTSGRLLLERIKSRELTLTDTAGNSLLLQPMVTSYPNATTDQTGTDTDADTAAANNQDFGPVFRKAMRF